MNAKHKADVALLTDHRYEAMVALPGDWYLGNILEDDGLLQKELEGQGIPSVRVDWARKDMDWSQYKCVVFRTTWDYFDRFEEFSQWLNVVSKQTKLCNPYAIIKWNMDKHYLKDLESKGIPVTPSRFVEKGSTVNIEDAISKSGWHELVIKPCVSGAARHTYRVNKLNAKTIETVVNELLKHESFVYQPFLESVLTQGEDTLMLFDGKFSHAIRKLAKPGDFRVQDDHGGTVHDYQPDAEQIEFAEKAMAVCSTLPSYGRVDMVRDNQGKFALMELEMIEPELWLRKHPPSAMLFAESIARVVRG
jgi:glutathione synthase/RimK-type ligase-like ATP-grasp enzyme